MVEYQQQQLRLTGCIDYHNAEQVYQKGWQLLQQQQFPVVVNLSGLQQSSTLVLAVLIRWLRQTPQAKGLVLTEVPQQMLKIIQACHLEQTLQIQS